MHYESIAHGCATQSVLLVEDQSIVACDLERFLSSAGYRVVGPVKSLFDALDRIASEKIDSAIVDVALGDDATSPLAVSLIAANIPHIFVDGWAVGAVERHRGQALLNNPYDYRSVLEALVGKTRSRNSERRKRS